MEGVNQRGLVGLPGVIFQSPLALLKGITSMDEGHQVNGTSTSVLSRAKAAGRAGSRNAAPLRGDGFQEKGRKVQPQAANMEQLQLLPKGPSLCPQLRHCTLMSANLVIPAILPSTDNQRRAHQNDLSFFKREPIMRSGNKRALNSNCS